MNRKGEMYIDVVVTTLITAVAILAVLGVFACLYTYSKVNSLADNIADFAAITGKVDGAEFEDRYDELLKTYHLSKENTTVSYEQKAVIENNGLPSSAVQYGECLIVRFQYNYHVKYLGTNSQLNIPIRIKKARLSQNYWRTATNE